jgi:hypothetical protein
VLTGIEKEYETRLAGTRAGGEGKAGALAGASVELPAAGAHAAGYAM